MKRLTIITACLAGALLVLLLIGVPFRFFGYSFNMMPTELAQAIADNDESPYACLKLYVFDIGPRPTTGEHRMGCLYLLAQMKKDPEICGMLMPSEYGLSCLGEVWSRIDIGRGCSSYDTGEVICATTSGRLEAKAQTDNCNNYDREELRNWCHIERTRIFDVNECEKITNMPPFREQCQVVFAFKKKDLSLCNTIEDDTRRTVCEMRIEAWQQYSSLRGSIYFGTGR